MFIVYLYHDLSDIGFDIFHFVSVLFSSSWKAKPKVKVRACKQSSVVNRLLEEKKALKEEDECVKCRGTD